MTNNSRDYGIKASSIGLAASSSLGTQFGSDRLRWPATLLARKFGELLVGLTASTTPVVYSDPLREFQRSGISSISEVQKRRRRQFLTAIQVWDAVGSIQTQAMLRRLHRRREALHDLYSSISDELE